MEAKRWDLSHLTTGERSALRRAAGSLAYNVEARKAFYKIDPSAAESVEDKLYAALCFACIWRESDNAAVMPMEDCLRTICYADGELIESMSRRVDALLETSWAQDGYMLGKLNSLMKILHSRGDVMPDFEKLAKDLIKWNDEGRPVQRSWLRKIYQNKRKPDDDDEKGESNESK